MNGTNTDPSTQVSERPSSTAYSDLFDSLPIPAIVIDPRTERVVACNELAIDLFGYARAEFVGKPFEALSDTTTAHGRDRANEVISTVGSDRPVTIERQIKNADGRSTWIEISFIRSEIGGASYVLGTVVDTRSAVDEEENLEAFKTAVENAGHSIYWTDVDGTIQYVNPAFEEITGYAKQEAIGQNPRMLKSGVMSEDYYRNLWETVMSGETFQHEVVNESANGDQFVVSQTIAPIEKPTGEIERFVAVNSDITERKRYEQRLEAEKKHVEQLHQRLSVMNRILRHDIRSAVNIISGNAELAVDSEQHATEALRTIIDETDRLRRIAESVRHVEGAIDETDTKRTEIDVPTLLQTKVLGFRNEYPEASFDLSVPNQAVAKASDQFDLALEHLLSNAVDHNDRESPSIAVSVTDPTETDTIVIEIADDGPGIPEAEIQPLQAGRETPLEHTSGLGLWLSQWIISLSDGTLTFEKNDPRGTIARIELETAG